MYFCLNTTLKHAGISMTITTATLVCHCQGQMVARGTYNELQGSGVDFTSLLKENEGQEEERQDTTPIPISRSPHTLSDNSVSSMSSLSSSQYSLIEGAEPLAVVGIRETLNYQHSKLQAYWCSNVIVGEGLLCDLLFTRGQKLLSFSLLLTTAWSEFLLDDCHLY